MTQRVVNICYHCDHSVEQAGSHDEQIFHPLRSDMGKTKCKLPAKGHIARRQDNAREGVQALSRPVWDGTPFYHSLLYDLGTKNFSFLGL